MSRLITARDIILSKTFRKRENWKKVLFILKHTDIPIEVIVYASIVARFNNYHNFGHQLGVAESALKIIISTGGFSREYINLLVFALLFHDAVHPEVTTPFDELNAVEAMSLLTDKALCKSFTKETPDRVISFSRDIILSTIFSKRGQTNSPLELIAQDADLGHLGQGPYYWLWASMGLVDEMSRTKPITPIAFIREGQLAFIELLEKIGNGSAWVSPRTAKVFNEPRQDLETILNWNDSVITYAYNVRHQDITLTEFIREVDNLL